MYISPSLVDRFVEFVRRDGELTEGPQLVAVLLVGKAAETLAASHHYEFQGQKVGKAREEGLRGNGVSVRGFVRLKLRERGMNFSSPKRLGVNIKSCWRGVFLYLSKK